MNHLRMDPFLKLPDEVLVLIIKYINDNSKIETLISIPILQKYALQARYSRYQLDQFRHIPSDRSNSQPSDGTIKHLKELYEAYNFKPSRIVIKASKMHELLMSQEEPTDSHQKSTFQFEKMNQYRDAEFEILLTDSMDVDLELILREVNVVGVHFSKSKPKDANAESVLKKFSLYFQAIQFSNNNIQIMSTIYKNSLEVKFPTSLKKLTIDSSFEKNFDTNLNDLKCLEYFDCKNMSRVESLEALQLSWTIKSIKLRNCEFKTLGNLKNYNLLKCIKIYHCDNLYNIIKYDFPQSLEILVIKVSFKQEVTELYNSVRQGINKEFELSDFSRDGNSFILGSNFKLPSNTKILKIGGNSKIFELKPNICLEHLHTLKLSKAKNIDLNKLFASLPETMIKLRILSCDILKVDKCLKYPNIQQFYFSFNNVSNIFQLNLKQWIYLNNLEVGWNTLIGPGNYQEKLDPSWFLMNELDVFKEISECPNKKRKVCTVIKTLQIDIPSITHLGLIKSPEVSVFDNSNCAIHLPSQICIKCCTTLNALILSGLSIQMLDLNDLPKSLQKLTITKFESLQIKGKFSKLDQLTHLDLYENKFTYSVLAAQKFPSNLKSLDLSENKIENLSCLNLHNCNKLKILILEKVTELQEPNGANELKDFFIKSVGTEQKSFAIVTTYESKKVFSVINGEEILGNVSRIN
ncbi:uncharacterized protein KGF55_002935 [Candida pseudojiufengensis]|uniref:uncharacterized protein n=1 Tax=Candida pseudojiufengensis TaxID=497109 RepID=UPI0022257E1B|nr:uncharacterized protein KGF55_002935 [Candida pseudojiufengensis]KAI5963143.1 hypothetical protein KGF55_002935 [Candida pseudojiufengensis]